MRPAVEGGVLRARLGPGLLVSWVSSSLSLSVSMCPQSVQVNSALCDRSLAGLGSSCRLCPRVACGTRPGDRLGAELTLPACPSEGSVCAPQGLEMWQSRNCPGGTARRVLGKLGAGRKALPSPLQCGALAEPPENHCLHQAAGWAGRGCGCPGPSRPSLPLCAGRRCAWEAARARVCAPFPSVSDGPGGPGTPCALPRCWLATQGQGLPGGGAQHGPIPSLACRPKRETSWEDPMFLWGFESCQELVGSDWRQDQGIRPGDVRPWWGRGAGRRWGA